MDEGRSIGEEERVGSSENCERRGKIRIGEEQRRGVGWVKVV